MFVLDTNVLSEARKSKPDPSVVAWLTGQADEVLYTTAMNIYEIKRGILGITPQDTRQHTMFEAWLDRILIRFSNRILPLEHMSAIAAAESWKRTSVDVKDCVIGEIANQHDMVVVTRNVKDLSRIAHRTLNPWDC